MGRAIFLLALAIAGCTKKDPKYCSGCWPECAPARPDICAPEGGSLDVKLDPPDTGIDVGPPDVPPEAPACPQPAAAQINGRATVASASTLSTDPGCQQQAGSLAGAVQLVTAGKVINQPVSVLGFTSGPCAVTLRVALTFPGDGGSCEVDEVLTMEFTP